MDVSKMSKEQMQDALRALGLPVSGTAAELGKRLTAAESAKKGAESAPAESAAPAAESAKASAAESAKAVPVVAARAMVAVLACPGCRRTGEAVNVYATRKNGGLKTRYCKCRHCGRVWKDIQKA